MRHREECELRNRVNALLSPASSRLMSHAPTLPHMTRFQGVSRANNQFLTLVRVFKRSELPAALAQGARDPCPYPPTAPRRPLDRLRSPSRWAVVLDPGCLPPRRSLQ